MPSLTFLNGPYPGRIIEVPDTPFAIGRHKECNLTVEDLSVSSRHAEIHCEKNIWSVRDLGSSNGTTLNGSATEFAVIKDGDLISVGDLELQFNVAPTGGRTLGPDNLDFSAIQRELDALHAEEAMQERLDSNSVILEETPVEAVGQLEMNEELLNWLEERKEVLYRQMNNFHYGRQSVVDQIMICLLARGHALLTAPGGVGRSELCRSLARALDFHFNRIHCHPGLSSSELEELGFIQPALDHGQPQDVYSDPAAFSNLILAKDIEASPRQVQTLLIHSLQRSRIEVGNYGIVEPCLILASRQSYGEAAYPLSPAQRSVFCFNIDIGYPDAEHEEKSLNRLVNGNEQPSGPNEVAFNKNQIIQLQDLVPQISIEKAMLPLALALIRGSRPEDESAPKRVREGILNGASTRSGSELIRAAQAAALFDGRFHATVTDLLSVTRQVLSHRLVPVDASVDLYACLEDIVGEVVV